ncbi:MAG TPA: aminopeptidase P family protein [Gemmatimonadales bacterium]|nr:aminopeptidase P family protein [Gemmatimonadales bacterium]
MSLLGPKSPGGHPSRVRALPGASACALALSLLAGSLEAQVGSPAGPVPPRRLAARRAALLERLGTGVAILRSAVERSIEGDYPQDSDYREDNDFFYLTGIEAPGAWLVLVAREDGPDEVILYLPPRDTLAERWTGPKLGPGPEATRLTGIEDVRPAEQAESEIRALLRPADSPARRGALYIERGREEAQSGFFRDLVFTPSSTRPLRVDDLEYQVAQLRLIKDEDEIARMRRAVAITVEGHRAAWRAARPGVHEYELEAALEGTFRRLGAERVGYPSIVGSGINSTILHYDKNRRKTEPGDLVLIDAGAEFGYHSADVTRTFPVSGKFTPRQRAIYDLVLAAQRAAIDSVRPGITVARLNQIAREYLRTHSGDLCGGASCDRYMPHGLSHWLGMDVHDVGDYGTPLAPGMILTIEPGIYLPAERFGVRIEDVILVTERGAEVLSAALPREAAEVERAMGAAPAPARTAR